MAVVLTDGPGGSLEMCVGADMAGRVFVDLLKGRAESVAIPENGNAVFPVNGGSVAVWVPAETAGRIGGELEALARSAPAAP